MTGARSNVSESTNISSSSTPIVYESVWSKDDTTFASVSGAVCSHTGASAVQCESGGRRFPATLIYSTSPARAASTTYVSDPPLSMCLPGNALCTPGESWFRDGAQ
jgi:hypothetical protein